MRFATPVAAAAALSALLLATPAPAGAQTLLYGFATTVASITGPLPPAFASAGVGDAVTGSLQFDFGATAAGPNPLLGVLGTGTYYPLAAASMTLSVDGVVVGAWSGTLTGLVWNDEPTINPGPNDGLLLLNIPAPGALQFIAGNLLYPTSQFGADALPTTTVTGTSVLSLGLAGQAPFLSTAAFSPIVVTAIPEPASLGLWLAGLGGVAARVARRRRYSTSLA